MENIDRRSLVLAFSPMVTWRWPRLMAVAPCGLGLYHGSPVRLALGWLCELGDRNQKECWCAAKSFFLHNMDLGFFGKLVFKIWGRWMQMNEVAMCSHKFDPSINLQTWIWSTTLNRNPSVTPTWLLSSRLLPNMSLPLHLQYCWCFRNPAPCWGTSSLSHYLQDFTHPRWCRNSIINCMVAFLFISNGRRSVTTSPHKLLP